MEVYIDPIAPAPALYIVGAGHVGWHLARMAADAGFRIHVIDDREKFANAERFPSPRTIEVDDIGAWLHRAELPPTAYVVVVTRGHTHDFEALRALAARDLRYIGLIGSRAKVARIFDALAGRGDAGRSASRACTPRSASTSARSRRPRSPSASSPSSSRCDTAGTCPRCR